MPINDLGEGREALLTGSTLLYIHHVYTPFSWRFCSFTVVINVSGILQLSHWPNSSWRHCLLLRGGGKGGGGQGWRYSKYKNRPFPSSKDPLLVQCYHWRLFFVSTGEPFGRWRSVSKECLSSKKSLWCREISPFPLTSAVSTDHAFR